MSTRDRESRRGRDEEEDDRRSRRNRDDEKRSAKPSRRDDSDGSDSDERPRRSDKHDGDRSRRNNDSDDEGGKPARRRERSRSRDNDRRRGGDRDRERDRDDRRDRDRDDRRDRDRDDRRDRDRDDRRDRDRERDRDDRRDRDRDDRRDRDRRRDEPEQQLTREEMRKKAREVTVTEKPAPAPVYSAPTSTPSSTGGWSGLEVIAPKPKLTGAADENCSECDEPGHHSADCLLKTSIAQGTHNSLFMGDFNEDDIPDGQDKETYMFEADKNREALLFSFQLASLDFSNYEKFKVEIEGKDIPDPLDTFQSFKWPPVIENAIALNKWKVPTPVQKYALPSAIRNRDIMASAQTGSGKTACYLMPMVRYLLVTRFEKDANIGSRRVALPSCLVIAPVRELAQQIHVEAAKFTYRSTLHSVCIYGGSGYQDQLAALRKGCDILVATPGRLLDMIEKGHIDLERLKFLVLDEADRMLDMGFKGDIEAVVRQCPAPRNASNPNGRQTLMFSATFPKDIQLLAQDFLQEDHIFIQVGRCGSTTDLITQQFMYLERNEKRDALLGLLKEVPGKTLVFAQTKRECEFLEKEIKRAGVRCMAMHGDKSQQSREIALKKFKTGEIRVIVATDVASRGLDVADIKHVVNYDLATHIDDYVHRIGRTGRAGNKGLATSFYNSANSNIARDLKELLMESSQKVPDFIEADSEYATGSTFRAGSRPSAPKVSIEREKPADWDCPSCGATNFASRTACFKRTCGAAKPTGGNPRVTDNRRNNNNDNGGGDWGGGGGSSWGGGGGADVNTSGGGWGGGESKPAADSQTSGWGASTADDTGSGWGGGGW